MRDAGEDVGNRNADSLLVTRVTSDGAEPVIGPPTLLFAGRNYITAPFEPLWDVSPDGQRFVMVREAPGSSLKLVVLVNGMDAVRR